LSGVALGLEAVETALPADPGLAATLAARIRLEVQSAVAEIRSIIDALQPIALENVDLVTALRERADAISLRARDLVVTVEADEPIPVIPPDVARAAWRIADEAINNVVRHACASRCVVRICVGECLVVSVIDDGVGMPADPRHDGVGLASMRERANQFGGELAVDRASGGGTTVEARLPLVGAAVPS
jgi:signal transduction histidine kinase